MSEVFIERASQGASRRAFLKTGVAATGGVLLFGFRMPFAGAAGDKPSAVFAPNAFIRIDRQGIVTLIMPQVEMGQGVYTSIPMILAEELDANWDKVTVEHAPPDRPHSAMRSTRRPACACVCLLYTSPSPRDS